MTVPRRSSRRQGSPRSRRSRREAFTHLLHPLGRAVRQLPAGLEPLRAARLRPPPGRRASGRGVGRRRLALGHQVDVAGLALIEPGAHRAGLLRPGVVPEPSYIMFWRHWHSPVLGPSYAVVYDLLTVAVVAAVFLRRGCSLRLWQWLRPGCGDGGTATTGKESWPR